MKKLARDFFIVLTVVLITYAFPIVTYAVKEKFVSADEAIKTLESLKGKTEMRRISTGSGFEGGEPGWEKVYLAKEYFWKIHKWSSNGDGIVKEIRQGRRTTKVLILTSASDPMKGYNVVLTTKKPIRDLKKGDVVSFSGWVNNWSKYRGVSIIIVGEYTTSYPLSKSKDDPYEQLEKLKELYDKGIISEKEYNKKKKELLNRI